MYRQNLCKTNYLITTSPPGTYFISQQHNKGRKMKKSSMNVIMEEEEGWQNEHGDFIIIKVLHAVLTALY